MLFVDRAMRDPPHTHAVQAADPPASGEPSSAARRRRQVAFHGQHAQVELHATNATQTQIVYRCPCLTSRFERTTWRDQENTSTSQG
ncbi:hypothetical protein GQ600_7416 [Phytophthora cactorum]|nr:hypothetical protein GQ600_7416 [Phytophthora cactorum]